MKLKSLLSIVALVCVVALSACSGGDAKKLLLGDTDKYGNTPKQAVERLFNTLPGENNIILLKEAVKFKENDKLSDYQKDQFFKQIKEKKFNVKATKERTHGDQKTVTVSMSEPSEETASVTELVAPLTRLTSTTSATTPMMMPSMVSMALILLAPIERSAMRSVIIRSPPKAGRRGCGRCVWPALPRRCHG